MLKDLNKREPTSAAGQEQMQMLCGIYWACAKNSREASAAEAEWTRVKQ